jgi:hypothetical protein
MKILISNIPKIILILLIILPILAFGYYLIIVPPYSIKEDQTGEKYNLYCTVIKIGMDREQVKEILSEKGEYREQVVRDGKDNLEVKILYEDEKINDAYGRIIIAYKDGIVYKILVGGGWDVMFSYCDK